MANETNQVNVNQIVEGGDAPALESQENRGAPGGQAVRSPQVVKRNIGVWFYSVFDVDGHNVKVVLLDFTPLYLASYGGFGGFEDEFADLLKTIVKYYGFEPVEVLVVDPDAGCEYPHRFKCVDNNLICYLARKLYEDEDVDVEGEWVCEDELASLISTPDASLAGGQFKVCFAHYDIYRTEDIAIAAARYAIEQLHIEEPVVIIATEGYWNAIVIAKEGD